MEFSEKKATEIVEKFNLSPQTIATWRMRGKIPDKYKGEAPVAKLETKADFTLQERLIKNFKSDKVNAAGISELSGILDQRKIANVIAGKTNLTAEELASLKIQLSKLKQETKEMLTALNALNNTSLKKLESYSKHAAVKFFIVINRNRDIYHRIEWAIKSDNPQHIAGDLDKIRHALLVFSTEIITQ